MSEKPIVALNARCAFLLGTTVEHHLEQSASPWAPKLIRGSYVDNYLVSVDEPHQIGPAAKEIRNLFWQAGFNCRQFLSNEREEVVKLPIEWQETKKQVSLLGVQRDTVTDEFLFRLPSLDIGSKLTKRSILSHIASVYDPCGLISPALLPAKNAQAKIWALESGAGWDDRISDDNKAEFLAAMSFWENVEFRFPRRGLSSNSSSCGELQMHRFSDASENGIGIAVYIRYAAVDYGESCLIFARSLVVPTSLRPKATEKGAVRQVSIPRLELQVTTMLAKAVTQLKGVFQAPISSIQLWTDSSTVVQWLKAGEHKEVFVRNRVPIIRDYQVNHVSTSENPAHIASRGIEPRKLMDQQIWWHGPTWLSSSETEWPRSEFIYRLGDEKVLRAERGPTESVDCCVAVKELGPNEHRITLLLLNVADFRNLYKAQRILIRVLRFVKIKILSKVNVKNEFAVGFSGGKPKTDGRIFS